MWVERPDDLSLYPVLLALGWGCAPTEGVGETKESQVAERERGKQGQACGVQKVARQVKPDLGREPIKPELQTTSKRQIVNAKASFCGNSAIKSENSAKNAHSAMKSAGQKPRRNAKRQKHNTGDNENGHTKTKRTVNKQKRYSDSDESNDTSEEDVVCVGSNFDLSDAKRVPAMYKMPTLGSYPPFSYPDAAFTGLQYPYVINDPFSLGWGLFGSSGFEQQYPMLPWLGGENFDFQQFSCPQSLYRALPSPKFSALPSPVSTQQPVPNPTFMHALFQNTSN
jgi:ribosome-associated translation inhibitor RaiA